MSVNVAYQFRVIEKRYFHVRNLKFLKVQSSRKTLPVISILRVTLEVNDKFLN